MPLDSAFQEKLVDIRGFMEIPPLRLLLLQHDPDLKQPLMRTLLGLQDDEDFPHLFIYSDLPFHGYRQYFEELLQELSEANERLREDLAEVGVPIPPVPPGIPERDWTPAAAAARLAEYQSAVAESLPESMGSVVLILDPSEVRHEDGFAWSVLTLASSTASDWAKYILLDRRQGPMVGNPEDYPEFTTVVQWYLSPEQIEAQVNQDLAGGKLSPEERRGHLLLAGAFAASAGRREEAEERQLEALELAEKEGSPPEQANVLYNLGNNYLEQQRLTEAEDAFLKSAQICLEHQVNPLLALVLTNLGVTLHRQGRIEESLESFDAARKTFKALNNPPGEAHVLDNKARILHLEKRLPEAEASWLEALEVYESITAPHMEDVRQSGCEDIRAKLARFYEDTGQKQKIRPLSSGGR